MSKYWPPVRKNVRLCRQYSFAQHQHESCDSIYLPQTLDEVVDLYVPQKTQKDLNMNLYLMDVFYMSWTRDQCSVHR